MRKVYFIFVALMILIICVCLIIPIMESNKEHEIQLQNKLIKSEQYLSKKYSCNMKLLNYGIKDSFVANYCLAENPDIKFSVEWWVNYNEFNDDFLQQCLTYELKQMISEELLGNNIQNFEVHIGTMIGPPRELTKRLYEYYQKLAKIPKIDDIKTSESFMNVHITVDKSVNKSIVYNILYKMNLPTEKLEVST